MSEPFGARTTLRVGGDASSLVEVESVDELVALSASLDPNVAVFVLGRGSNTLVADKGFAGVVIHLADGFTSIEIDLATRRVTAGAGADLPVGARRSVDAGLTGFEWAVGVPGSIGGGVRMNAGGHGSDMAASVASVDVVDLDAGVLRRIKKTQLGFGYRSSAITERQVVVSCELKLAPGDPETGRATIKEIVRWRREHQPGGANCGSVFTNPPGDSAGRLIDAAGLRGLRIGTAEVSRKHANFIQADPDGSADDVAALIDEVIRRVHASSGVQLHTEVRMVGFGAEAG